MKISHHFQSILGTISEHTTYVAVSQDFNREAEKRYLKVKYTNLLTCHYKKQASNFRKKTLFFLVALVAVNYSSTVPVGCGICFPGCAGCKHITLVC